MGLKTLLVKVQKSLGLRISKKETKKESVIHLIDKLVKKLKKTKRKLKKVSNKQDREILVEKKALIKLQLKKATKVLKKLDK